MKRLRLIFVYCNISTGHQAGYRFTMPWNFNGLVTRFLSEILPLRRKPSTIHQSPGIEVCLLLLNIHYGRHKIQKVRQHTNTTINYLSLSFCFKRILGKKS